METRRRRVGRPSSTVRSEAVAQLRTQGKSWRQIARALGIGTATAMRLYDARISSGKASQNSPRAESDLEVIPAVGQPSQNSGTEAA